MAPARGRLLRTVACSALVSLGLGGTAAAAVRSGSVADPRDQAPGNRPPDLERLAVSYDGEAGELVVTLRIHRPLTGSDREGYSKLNVGVGTRLSPEDECLIGAAGDLLVDNDVVFDFSSGGYAEMVEGDLLFGSLTSGSPDAQTFVSTFRDPALRERDYRCAGRIALRHESGRTDEARDFTLDLPPSPGEAPPAPPAPPPTVGAQGTAGDGAPGPAPVSEAAASPASAAPPPRAGPRLAIRSVSSGRRSVRVRVACSVSRAGVLTVRSRATTVRQAFRCRAGRIVVVRAPAAGRRMRLTVQVGDARVSRTVG